jgi:CRP-like cAMP-binding protein
MELQALIEHPFLRTLTPQQVERLLPCAGEVSFPQGSFIFREGGVADAFFLVRTGRVALEQHIPGKGVVQVESLGPGDILGLSWLFPSAVWTLDARCVEPVQAFVFRAGDVRRRMQEDPALGHALATHLVQALYQRLMRVRLQRLDVYRGEG